MWVTTPMILLAVVAILALACIKLSTPTTYLNETNKLVTSSSVPVLPATDTVQPDRARSLRAVNTTAADTIEERAGMQPPAGWEANLAKIAEDSFSVKTKLPIASSDGLVERMEGKNLIGLSRQDEMLRVIKQQYATLTPKTTILHNLRDQFSGLTAEEKKFATTQISTLAANSRKEMMKTTKECVRKRMGWGKTLETLKNGRTSKFPYGELDLAKKQYNKELMEMVKEEVYSFLDRGFLESDIDTFMWKTYMHFHKEGLAYITSLYRQWEKTKQLEFMEAIEHHLVEGRTPDEAYLTLKSTSPNWSSKHSEIADFCIKQWFEKNDPEMHKVLQEWVAMGESSGIVHKLLGAHQSNPLISLNTRNPTYHVQMPVEFDSSTFKTWFQENLRPYQVGKNLQVENAAKGSPEATDYEVYVILYEKAEVDLVRMLATWWNLNLEPKDVAERLKLSKFVHSDGMKGEFYSMYQKLWEEKRKP